jgi:hypothetical protein
MSEATPMKRIYVNLTDEQAAALKARARETGVPQAEQIRRAITSALGDKTQRQQPVLFVRQER